MNNTQWRWRPFMKEKNTKRVSCQLYRSLRGPDRWSERVSALGPAVRREAPPAQGKKERERQDGSSLREPRLGPAARLVAAPDHERTLLTDNECLQRNTHCAVFDWGVRWLGRTDRSTVYYIYTEGTMCMFRETKTWRRGEMMFVYILFCDAGGTTS